MINSDIKLIAVAVMLIGILFSSWCELVQDEFPEFENRVTINTIIASGDYVKVYLAYKDELNETRLKPSEMRM